MTARSKAIGFKSDARRVSQSVSVETSLNPGNNRFTATLLFVPSAPRPAYFATMC